MTKITIAAAVFAVALVGCAANTVPPGSAPTAASPAPSTVRPVLADAVSNCAYIDDVASVSSRYGIFASQALEDTRGQVLTKAEALGATHLVWEAPVVAHGSTTSRGKAYRCS